MTLNLAIQCALLALVLAAVLVLSEALPVMAEEDGKKVKMIFKILTSADGEVKARIVELQQQGIDIPLGANAYHVQALSEYNEAQQALESGNTDLAKTHAMEAMELFKQATDLLPSIEEEGPEETDILIEINEKIMNLQHQAEHLRILANNNEVSVTLSDYDAAIGSASDALEGGSVEEAMEQLASAKSILSDIQKDIQVSADSKKEERIKEFAQNLVTHLSKIVTQAEDDESGDREAFIEKLKTIIDELNNTNNVEEIMDMTDDSSDLQIVIRDYEDHFDSIPEVEENVEPGITDEVENGETVESENDENVDSEGDVTSESADTPDTISPSISPPSDITQEATGKLTPVDLDVPTVSDNEDPSPIISNDAPEDGFPVGTTKVTWTVTDVSGNSATATQSVTIIDTTAPSITAPEDITVEVVEAVAELTHIDLGAPTVSDIVDDWPTITNDAPVDGFPVGTTIVTWTATDESGNSATATQSVTIIVSVSL